MLILLPDQTRNSRRPPMNFRQMTDEQIALILMGLRSIYVHDSEETRLKLMKACETALSSRGKSLAA
jgi:hypothetical protein